MFSYIKGRVEEIGEDSIVLDHDGIGFFIYVPRTVLAKIPGKGMELTVYTYFQVREDGMALFGFLDRDTKHTFELLIGVNGIGPKNALSVLSTMTVDELRFAIASEDAKQIAKVPGVGTKTAQRIIIDLKDKISFLEGAEEGISLSGDASAKDNSVRDDAILALVALGYSQTESYKAVGQIEISEDTTVEMVLKAALKKML